MKRRWFACSRRGDGRASSRCARCESRSCKERGAARSWVSEGNGEGRRRSMDRRCKLDTEVMMADGVKSGGESAEWCNDRRLESAQFRMLQFEIWHSNTQTHTQPAAIPGHPQLVARACFSGCSAHPPDCASSVVSEFGLTHSTRNPPTHSLADAEVKPEKRKKSGERGALEI